MRNIRPTLPRFRVKYHIFLRIARNRGKLNETARIRVVAVTKNGCLDILRHFGAAAVIRGIERVGNIKMSQYSIDGSS